MSDPACARFLAQLDHAGENAFQDPHASTCRSCGVALRAAAAMRSAMSEPAQAPPDFAARVAYLAWTDARERRRAGDRWGIRGTAIAGPVAASALGIGMIFALPPILDVVGELPQTLASIGGFPIQVMELAAIGLLGTACLALASVRLSRRRV
jgi:hypothetical protein